MEFSGKCCPGLDVCVRAVGPFLALAVSELVSQSGGKFLLLEFWEPFAGAKGKSDQETLVVSAPILSPLNF